MHLLDPSDNFRKLYEPRKRPVSGRKAITPGEFDLPSSKGVNDPPSTRQRQLVQSQYRAPVFALARYGGGPRLLLGA